MTIDGVEVKREARVLYLSGYPWWTRLWWWLRGYGPTNGIYVAQCGSWTKETPK